MGQAFGFRKVKVFKDVAANTDIVVDDFQYSGAYMLVEVTNKTASDVDFIVNEHLEGGRTGVAIPIPASQTRQVPMAITNFKTTGVVTVVAYGM